MAKLSEQLPQEPQQRTTRTQRVIAQRKREQSQREFDALKREAEQLQSSEFSDISSIEEYEDKYNRLDPRLKPFFASPTQLRENKTERIAQSKIQVQNRISYAQNKYEQERARHEREIQQLREQRSQARNSDERRRLKEQEEREDNKWDERRAYWDDYIKGLRSGLSGLNEGKDLSYSSVEGYADELGGYTSAQVRARNRQKEQSQRAFDKLLKESPFAKVYADYDAKYKGSIDWTKEKNLKIIRTQNYAQKYPQRYLQSLTKDLTPEKTYTSPSSSGGYSEITYFTDKSGKRQLQLIRSQRTGELQYTKVGGVAEGVTFKGLTDKEIEAEQEKFEAQQSQQQIQSYEDFTSSFGISRKFKFGDVELPYQTRGTISNQPNTVIYPIEQDRSKQKSQKVVEEQRSKTNAILNIEKGEFVSEYDYPYNLERTIDTSQFGYNTRGTISNQPKIDVQAEPVKLKDTVKGDGFITNVRKLFPDFYLNPTGTLPFPISVTTYKQSDKSIGLTEYVAKKEQATSQAQTDLQLSKLVKSGDKQKIDEEIQKEFEADFWRSDIGRKAYFDRLEGEDLNKAVNEFIESGEGDYIQKKYELRIGEELGKTSRVSDLFVTSYGAKSVLLAIDKTVWTILPTSPEGAIVEATALYGAGRLLKSIPPIALTATTAGIGTYGTFKALDPKLPLAERAGGLVTAGISFGILGYQVYKTSKLPSIRYKRIEVKPTLSTKQQQEVYLRQGYGVTIDKKGNYILQEFGGVSRKGEILISGRRTIVSTKGRDFLGLKPIYQGVPTQQLGTKITYKSLRGTYVTRNKGAYQKALDLLTKRGGLTTAQAKATLRYYQPQRILTDFNARTVTTYGDTIKQPKVDLEGYRDIVKKVEVIDKNLGIKTRGGVTVRELIAGKGKLLGEYKGLRLSSFSYATEKTYLSNKGSIYQKLSQAGKTTVNTRQLNFSLEKKTGVAGYVKIRDKIVLFSPEAQYKTFGTQSLSKQLYPARSKIIVQKSNSVIFENRIPYNKEFLLDERELDGLRVKEGIIRATAKSDVTKLNDPKYLKEVIKTAKSIYGKERVSQVVKELRIQRGFQPVNLKGSATTSPSVAKATASKSKYYGTGLYERTQGGLVQTDVKSIDLNLKVAPRVTGGLEPALNLRREIRALAFVDQTSKGLVGLGLLSAVGLRTGALTITAPKLRIDPYTAPKIDVLTETETVAGVDVATRSAVKTQTNLRLNTKLIGVNAPLPKIPRPPITPPIRPPPKPFIFYLPSKKGQNVERKTTKQAQQFAYLPDFTSRALGLKEEQITEKEAQKRLKRILTGLELRRPVKVRF